MSSKNIRTNGFHDQYGKAQLTFRISEQFPDHQLLDQIENVTKDLAENNYGKIIKFAEG